MPPNAPETLLSFNWRTVVKWGAPLLLLLVLAFLRGREIAAVLAPFLIGLLLAYVFDPVVSAISGRFPRLGRVGAAALLYLALAFIVLVPGTILSVILANQTLEYGQKILDRFEDVHRRMTAPVVPDTTGEAAAALPEATGTWARLTDKWSLEDLRARLQRLEKTLAEAGVSREGMLSVGRSGISQAGNLLYRAGSFVWDALVRGLGGLARFSTLLALVLVVTFYLLVDFNHFKQFCLKLVPERAQGRFQKVVGDIDLQLSGFLRGQALIAVAMGVMMSVGSLLIGLNGWLIVGLVAGVFNIIPYLGPAMGLLTGVVLIVVEQWDSLGSIPWMLFKLVLMFGVVQAMDGMVISPRIMSNKVDIHPLIVMLALLLGGRFFGLPGMLLAVPAACVARVVLKEFYFPQFSPAPRVGERRRSRRGSRGGKAGR